MKRREQYLILTVILIMISFLILSGCVEVTPPSGTKNASGYAGINTSGNLTAGLEKRTPGPEGSIMTTTGSSAPTQAPPVQSPQPGTNATPGPEGKLPTPPTIGVVQVTPKSYEGLPQAQTTQPYSAKANTSGLSPGNELFPIYSTNHSFMNDAVAYAYVLDKAPLFIDLKFSPVLGKDIISYQKRTGDKEGQIDVTVNRPVKDAWFELRVYDQKDGSEVLREGYGKTYSLTNKTVTIRKPGSYQFDMLGNFMNASVILKVPISNVDISQYQNLTGEINQQKEDAGKIKAIFLTIADLPAGWTTAGDIIRTENSYQSMFKKDEITLRQKISKFDSTDKAIAELNTLKNSAGPDSMGPSLLGQQGFLVDKSQMKTQLVFVESLYLVDLSSYTPPNPVPSSDLNNYGKIIITRINS